MKLKKFNQINEDDRIGFDDIDEPIESKPDKDLSWLDDSKVDDEAKKAAEQDLKTDPGYQRLHDQGSTGVGGYDDYGEEIDPYGNYSTEDSKTTSKKRVKPQISEEEEDEVREFTYMLRKIIKGANIDNFYVTNDGFDICIQFIFQKVDKMRSIMRVTNVLKKIHEDILIQYDSEIEMWETTKGEPLFTVDFYYAPNKSGSKKDVAPF